jgi:sialic acid synthase SpsE
MTTIVAEIGTHHMGDMILGRQLVALAKANRADMAKFQLFDTEKLTHWPTPEIKAEAKKCELTFEQAMMLFRYGEEIGIEVFFSVFDPTRVDWCEKIGVRTYKIAASDFPNKSATVAAVFDTGKPCIFSYSHKQALHLWAKTDSPFKGLYCVTNYPADIQDIDWAILQQYNGFSDHTIGLDAAKIAIAKGASMIEKHFALDHSTGMDARWSMTPDELKELRRWADLV